MENLSFVSECHRAACRYLELGWSVLPFCDPQHENCRSEHSKRCSSPGKVPMVGKWDRWKVYQNQRIPVWLLNREFGQHPKANIGVVLGELSGLIGVDVDGPKGCNLLLEIIGDAIESERSRRTLAFRTYNGFRLLYSMADGEIVPQNRKVLLDGSRVEILGNGNCSVMPPSLHKEGITYSWMKGRSPQEIKALPLPAWLYKLSEKEKSLDRRATKDKSPFATLDREGPIREFRNVRLFRAACSLRRQGADGESILACLLILNRRCEPPLDEAEIRRISRNSTRYAPQCYKV